MKKKIRAAITIAVVIMILTVLPCLAQAAGVATDYQSYAQEDVVTIVGFGWQPGESISLKIYNVNNLNAPHYTFSNPSQADSNGIFTSTEYIIMPADEEQTFLLVAEGLDSGLAQTIFDDAPHLHFFEDVSQNITRDAFAWGTTVHARADDLGTTRPCWQIRWIDPNNNVVETHNLDVLPLTDNRNDSFVVPASGPSGVWRAELYRPSTIGTCASGPSFTLRHTLYFDVAQIVVIGADDSYITNHFPNFNSNSTILFQFSLDVNNDANDTEKTFLRFNLPIITGDVISAKVRTRLLWPPSSWPFFPNSRTYNINRVTSSWNVNTITWNNQPNVAGTFTDSQPTPTGLFAPNSLMYWDVTSDVTGFARHSFANNGWRIVDSQAQDPEGIFASTEVNTLLGNKLNGPVLLIDTQQRIVPVPTMTKWGMIICIAIIGLGAVFYLRRLRRAES